MSFEPAKQKLTIASLDEALQVSAQYNPKDLQVDQSVPWKKPDAATQTSQQPGASGTAGATKAKGPDENYMALEFVGAEGRTMSVEMLFDGYEKGQSVAAQVGILETLARVRAPDDPDEKMRRPHHCVVSWGVGGMPTFRCVIESLSTKYSMFSTEGVPLRATCTVKLKEAARVDKKKKGA